MFSISICSASLALEEKSKRSRFAIKSVQLHLWEIKIFHRLVYLASSTFTTPPISASTSTTSSWFTSCLLPFRHVKRSLFTHSFVRLLVAADGTQIYNHSPSHGHQSGERVWAYSLSSEVVLRKLRELGASSEMTPNTRHLKWKIACLALFLMCQTTWQTEGHPDANKLTRVPRNLARQYNISVNRTAASPELKQLSRENHERSDVDMFDGRIVFPSDDVNFRRNMVESCPNSTFCEYVNNYPTALVDRVIMENSGIKSLSTVDVTDVAQRIDPEEDTPLCDATEKVVFPQTAENIRNKWLYILNHENVKQGVRVEVCRNEEASCNAIEGFSLSYQTICRQKYIIRQLIALGDDGNAVMDMFRFPSSCCCFLKPAPI